MQAGLTRDNANLAERNPYWRPCWGRTGPAKHRHVSARANKVVFIADSQDAHRGGRGAVDGHCNRSVQRPTGTRRPWAMVVSQRQEAGRAPDELQEDLGEDSAESGCPLLSALRPPLDVRHEAVGGWRGRRVGHPAPSADRRQGVQEVFADEAPNEARDADQAQPPSQRIGLSEF
jgi:hypothetical protein